MPRRDATGPQGMGPLTGRGMGSCQGEPRFYRNGLGRQRGRGFGRGMGMFYRTNQPSIEDLKLEKKDLEQRLQDIDRMLNKE